LKLKGDDRAPFMALNRNKRSVVLDLKLPGDLQQLHALARDADVFVENFRPGVASRLGLGYEGLRSINPRIVYASISGFGQTGPYADRPGFDLIAQGMSGIMSVTGAPGGDPVKAGVPVSDLAAGLYAATAILAALHARDRTGEGQWVETSLFEAALGLSVWESTEYFATGEPPQALGSAHRLSAPYQAFRAADGWLTIAALTPAHWERLCTVLARPALALDPRFATNADRMAHRDALANEIQRALTSGTVAEWVSRLLGEGIPAGPLYDYAQVFADPHVAARRMVETIEHPVEGTVRTLGIPIKMTGTPPSVRLPPPLLGEHTDAIRRVLEQGTNPWRERT
jgi:formyl-CoA transferase